MRTLIKRLALITPAFAIAAGTGGAGQANTGNDDPHSRALALSVVESGDRVEIELIAHSDVAQQVQYEIELIGNSKARHNGDTRIPAGNRQVLSRLVTNVSDTWCATVAVVEGNGATYTLTAGDCS
ncbi:curli-like amyloid fiber formation chaperone CsgH [Erythrobacter sp. Alg231-14]|uniref:curli-like amyloid fiber formation chaperone CsgH n=1 Tax=Erythrobacter sp. Alg231-14 TaxID=1922225 RepID=UPI000D54D8E2